MALVQVGPAVEFEPDSQFTGAHCERVSSRSGVGRSLTPHGAVTGGESSRGCQLPLFNTADSESYLVKDTVWTVVDYLDDSTFASELPWRTDF